ncbi:MAG TPA: type 1 glutamine amidotransferase domain-containing protein [Gemmatimonadales bacterium]
MSDKLKHCRVAILATEGVERIELTEPRRALDDAGAHTTLIAPKGDTIKAWEHDHWGEPLEVDALLSEVQPDDFDALLLPGGVINADKIRVEPKAVEFVRHFVDQGKPMAVICHAPWLLIEAKAVRARTVTSWPTLKTDLINAGANWVDEAVVVHHGLVTSRKPDDIPAFNRKMIEEFAEGAHVGASSYARA